MDQKHMTKMENQLAPADIFADPKVVTTVHCKHSGDLLEEWIEDLSNKPQTDNTLLNRASQDDPANPPDLNDSLN